MWILTAGVRLSLNRTHQCEGSNFENVLIGPLQNSHANSLSTSRAIDIVAEVKLAPICINKRLIEAPLIEGCTAALLHCPTVRSHYTFRFSFSCCHELVRSSSIKAHNLVRRVAHSVYWYTTADAKRLLEAVNQQIETGRPRHKQCRGSWRRASIERSLIRDD